MAVSTGYVVHLGLHMQKLPLNLPLKLVAEIDVVIDWSAVLTTFVAVTFVVSSGNYTHRVS